MRSVTALYVANAREFLRDKMASFLTLLLPLLFAIFFGLLFGGTSSYHLNLGLIVEDNGPVGQGISQALSSEDAQQMMKVTTGSRDEVLDRLNKGEVDVVVVLPAGLTQSVSSGMGTPIEVYYDQARQVSSGVGLGVVRSLLAEMDLGVRDLQPLLVPEVKAIQTTPLRSVDFFIPSLLAMAMLWLGLFGTMLPLVEQREQQVLRRLSASPVPRINLLCGQVLWRLTVGLAQAVIFVAVGVLVLGVQVHGNWLLFIAMVVLGALVFISMGYLLAGLSRTSESAVALAQLVNFPLMFLSGIFFESQMLPEMVRPIMHLMPPAYLGDAFRQIMVGYQPVYPLWLDFAVLTGCLVVFVGLGLRFFRWEQA